jgi:hypothetical protein
MHLGSCEEQRRRDESRKNKLDARIHFNVCKFGSGISACHNLSMARNTITEEYMKQQQELHKNPNYGVASLEFSPLVAQLVKQANIQSISDYGAGKKRLLEGLKSNGVNLNNYYPFDPAFPEYGEPKSADLVCCIDVLEHIEPTKLSAVLEELASITVGLGFFSIHMGPAGKVLSDGRNAHLIQKPTSWWLPRLSEHFNVLELQQHQVFGVGFWCIVKKI